MFLLEQLKFWQKFEIIYSIFIDKIILKTLKEIKIPIIKVRTLWEQLISLFNGNVT